MAWMHDPKKEQKGKEWLIKELNRVEVSVHYYSSLWISIHRKEVTESNPLPTNNCHRKQETRKWINMCPNQTAISHSI